MPAIDFLAARHENDIVLLGFKSHHAEYNGGMEHRLFAPLLSFLASSRLTDSEDLSAANVTAWRLLRGPYLHDTYASWCLAETGPGDWRLVQPWMDSEIISRDVLEPFYADPYAEVWDAKDDSSPPEAFFLKPRSHQFAPPRLAEGEESLSAEIRVRADALLERVRTQHPAAVDRLLRPTPNQIHRRHALCIETVQGHEWREKVESFLGPFPDWSLRAYGIEYHNTPGRREGKDLYFVAHNAEEIAGIIKLGADGHWAYSVGYVSVAPGFRGKGLSRHLYTTALARCAADGRVLVRSTPGDRTPPEVTAAYDRLVQGAPVLHTASNGPLCLGLQKCFKTGRSYADLVAALKPACDDVLPSHAQRLARKSDSLCWEENEAKRVKHAAAFEAVWKPSPSVPRKLKY